MGAHGADRRLNPYIMQQQRVLGVIPARLHSRRLPRKPLYVLAGRPLIEWVWRAASRLQSLDALVVATDSEEVADACRALGAPVVLTAASHASGTDRVAEVADRPEYAAYDIVVNVQGDEPFITDAQIAPAVGMVRAGWEIATAAAPVASASDWRDPGMVNVVRADDGRALYFSRAPVPFPRDGEPDDSDLASERYLRHIGVYVYASAALRRWVALPVHHLERTERLEQLRPLAAGMAIGVAVVPGTEGGVDTPADVERAEARLRRREDEIPVTTGAKRL